MESFVDLYPNALEPELCREIIERFEKDEKNHFPGVVVYADGKVAVNPDTKKCTELSISGLSHWKDIDEIMYKKVGETLGFIEKKYPGFGRFGSINDEGYRVKKYHNDGADWFDWHIDTVSYKQAHRQLVFLWYLNTVEEGGETCFRNQNIVVKPEEGKLVTFPPFWTHEHMGRPPISEPKYLVACWATFEK